MRSDRDLILSVYRGEEAERIVWQPRLYYWYYAHRLPNPAPVDYQRPEVGEEYYRAIPEYVKPIAEEFQTTSMMELYRRLGASPRYAQEVLGVELFRLETNPEKIRVRDERTGNRKRIVRETPYGVLMEEVDHATHVEFPLKGPGDFDAMRYVLEHTKFTFDGEAYRIADEIFGESGIPQAFFPRTPLQRLFVEWMGIEATIWALYEHTEEVESFLEFIGEWDDGMYGVLAESPVSIFNFGENLDVHFDTPVIMEQYLLPYYKRRVEELHRAGKFCSIHADGAIRSILKMVVQGGFDAIEAPTAKPQGDVTLEEIKEALGGKILQDGIPALLLCREYSEDELLECVEKILQLFAPRLILGVSDEVPPDADLSRLQKIKHVVDEYTCHSGKDE